MDLVKDMSLEVRLRLCNLLDVDQEIVKNARHLAEEMEIDNAAINILWQGRGKGGDRKPTEAILNKLASLDKTIVDLEKLLFKIQRLDCVNILREAYPNLVSPPYKAESVVNAANGGVLKTPNATCKVEPGSLSKDTKITMVQHDEHTQFKRIVDRQRLPHYPLVFQFLPDGLAFESKGVNLRVEIDVDGAPEVLHVIHGSKSNNKKRYEWRLYDDEAKIEEKLVTVTIRSFSCFSIIHSFNPLAITRIIDYLNQSFNCYSTAFYRLVGLKLQFAVLLSGEFMTDASKEHNLREMRYEIADKGILKGIVSSYQLKVQLASVPDWSLTICVDEDLLNREGLLVDDFPEIELRSSDIEEILIREWFPNEQPLCRLHIPKLPCATPSATTTTPDLGDNNANQDNTISKQNDTVLKVDLGNIKAFEKELVEAFYAKLEKYAATVKRPVVGRKAEQRGVVARATSVAFGLVGREVIVAAAAHAVTAAASAGAMTVAGVAVGGMAAASAGTGVTCGVMAAASAGAGVAGGGIAAASAGAVTVAGLAGGGIGTLGDEKEAGIVLDEVEKGSEELELLIEQTANELCRILEYQLSMLKNPSEAMKLARVAAGLMVPDTNDNEDKIDANILVNRVLDENGKTCEKVRLKIKGDASAKGTWYAKGVFRKTGLRKSQNSHCDERNMKIYKFVYYDKNNSKAYKYGFRGEVIRNGDIDKQLNRLLEPDWVQPQNEKNVIPEHFFNYKPYYCLIPQYKDLVNFASNITSHPNFSAFVRGLYDYEENQPVKPVFRPIEPVEGAMIDLRNANMENSDLSCSEFQGFIFKGCNFKECRALGANFKDAVLENSVFDGAYFLNCCLENANVRSCSWLQANVINCDVTGADIRDRKNVTASKWDGTDLDKGIN